MELAQLRVGILRDRIAKTEAALTNVGRAGQALKEIEHQLGDIDSLEYGIAAVDDEVATRILNDHFKAQKKAYEYIAFLADHVVPGEVYRIHTEAHPARGSVRWHPADDGGGADAQG